MIKIVNARTLVILSAVVLALMALAGCASAPTNDSGAMPENRVASFASPPAANGLPSGWQQWIMSRLLKKTEYKVVHDNGAQVLEARSESAASGLLQDVSIDPMVQRHISWRWKVPQLIPTADNTRRNADDSPVRIVIAFDGDKKKFDFEDRAMADMVKLFSGREMPYATIMYIWENKLPVGTVLENAHSSRAKMIVAESGPKRVGQWLTLTRNVLDDYRQAYGEEPGKIISVGVMTDTNTTGSKVTAYYGDIIFSEALASNNKTLGGSVAITESAVR
jgi:Protein of unknown function (DUF3047)